MVRVSATQFQRQFGRFQDNALQEPLTITRDGRDRLVVLSAAEYQRLKRRDRQVMGLEDFTESDLDALSRSTTPDEAVQFDDELKR
jgi:prevent-host-death family protein